MRSLSTGETAILALRPGLTAGEVGTRVERTGCGDDPPLREARLRREGLLAIIVNVQTADDFYIRWFICEYRVKVVPC